MSAVSIKKGPIQLAGLLFKPPTQPNSSSKSPALLVVYPGGGVKEQTASLYAKKLAQEGFVTLCYDASNQGESGGEPHFLEDPSQRVSDVWSVVDYLSRQPCINPDKIGVVGICAGGGYAVAASKADYRVKAVATVSMVNIGDSARLGWYGDEDPSKHVETLNMAAQQRKAQILNRAERAAAPYVPPWPDHNTPHDLKEAHDYYLTARCHHPRATNKMLIDSLPLVLNFDAFQFADVFLKQPVLLIVGEKAGSRWHTERLDKLIGGADKKVVVPKGTHVDFYDKGEFIGPAVKEMAEFMKAKLV
jgi:uncharacterized protein